MLDKAHGSATAPEGTHQLDVRDSDTWAHLLHGVDVVCHQAAVVGAGVTVADLPAYASHNDLGTAALLVDHARGRRRPPGARVVDGGLRRGALRVRRAR